MWRRMFNRVFIHHKTERQHHARFDFDPTNPICGKEALCLTAKIPSGQVRDELVPWEASVELHANTIESRNTGHELSTLTIIQTALN
jgi:hypothetical protein